MVYSGLIRQVAAGGTLVLVDRWLTSLERLYIFYFVVKTTFKTHCQFHES